MQIEKESILLRCDKPLRAVSSISTMPYPGFPTDALAPVMAAACTAQGTTIFIENIITVRIPLVKVILLRKHAYHVISVKLSYWLSHLRVGVSLTVDSTGKSCCLCVKLCNLIPIK